MQYSSIKVTKRIGLFSIILFLILTISNDSDAGLMEISSSYGKKSSSIDTDNYNKSESWSGSFAWYFLEQSAFEVSYTKGVAEQSLKATTDTSPTIYYSDFTMYGADLVITLTPKGSFFQPFIRGGMAQLKKKVYREDPTGTITLYGKPVDEVVPSYGAGFKIFISEAFSIKAGYDRWKSGSSADKDIWDDSVKVGVSWFF